MVTTEECHIQHVVSRTIWAAIYNCRYTCLFISISDGLSILFAEARPPRILNEMHLIYDYQRTNILSNLARILGKRGQSRPKHLAEWLSVEIQARLVADSHILDVLLLSVHS